MNWQVWVFLIFFSMIPIGLFYMVFRSIADIFKPKKKTKFEQQLDKKESGRRLADANRFNADANEFDEN